MTTPEYILREDDETYHARSRSGEVLSSHMLSTFRWSPYKYLLKTLGQLPDPPSEALDFGRAAHCMILEGLDAFNERYTCGDGPVNPKTGLPFGTATKAYQEWKAEQTGEVISSVDFGRVHDMAEAVHRHPVAGPMLQGHMPEAVVRTEYAGMPCQIKMDAFRPEPGDIVDLKTTSDIAGFFYDLARPGYDYIFQAAFYRAVLRAVSGRTAHFFFVAVEKQFPYTVGVWHVSPDVLDQAESDNEIRIAALLECRRTGVYPTGYEDLREYDKMLF